MTKKRPHLKDLQAENKRLREAIELGDSWLKIMEGVPIRYFIDTEEDKARWDNLIAQGEEMQ